MSEKHEKDENQGWREFRGWEAIAREADVGTDDTARAKSKDRDLPLPVYYRGRFVFAREDEIEIWRRFYELLTCTRRMQAQTATLIAERDLIPI